jgi:hypothetical protein
MTSQVHSIACEDEDCCEQWSFLKVSRGSCLALSKHLGICQDRLKETKKSLVDDIPSYFESEEYETEIVGLQRNTEGRCLVRNSGAERSIPDG